MTAAAMSRVRKLGEHASIELSPGSADSFIETVEVYRGVDDLLSARRTVFVNMLERSSEGFFGVEQAVRALAEAGHNPVPNLPASVFESRSHAIHVCERLSRCGAKEAFVLGGNAPKTENGLDAVALGEVACHHFQSLVFAAFPDGHPRSPAGGQRLAQKLDMFPGAKVVTQWAPTPASTSQWLSNFLRSNHKDRRIHVGVCGPASCNKKQHFAKMCGVPLTLVDNRQLDTFESPRDAVLSLAADLEFYQVPQETVTLHLFALALGRTLDFLHRLTAHDVTSKSNLIAAA